jgi:uncharacterized membrane protein
VIYLNDINVKQNKEEILLYFFTQRKLYSKAKKINLLLFWIGVAIYILGLLPIVKSKFDYYYNVATVAWIVISQILNDRSVSTKLMAAEYQEYIDRSLFEFPINNDIISNLDKLRRCAIDLKIKHNKEFNEKVKPNAKETVYNWYSDVSNLPIEIARIFCQNENCHWENKLRRDYNKILYFLIITAVSTYVYLLVKYYSGHAIFNLIYAVPISIEIIKLIKHNNAIVKICDELEDRMNRVYTYISEKLEDMDNQYLYNESIAIQRKIFEYRKTNIPIPNFLYNFLRKRYQKESNQFIKMLKDEILEKYKSIVIED